MLQKVTKDAMSRGCSAVVALLVPTQVPAVASASQDGRDRQWNFRGLGVRLAPGLALGHLGEGKVPPPENW